MSDEMWQVPDDLADRLRRTDYSEAWAREIERTAELRGILTDLIAELRAMHYAHSCTDPEDYPCCCQECRQQWPCSIEASARSAEARLREVQGE